MAQVRLWCQTTVTEQAAPPTASFDTRPWAADTATTCILCSLHGQNLLGQCEMFTLLDPWLLGWSPHLFCVCPFAMKSSWEYLGIARDEWGCCVGCLPFEVLGKQPEPGWAEAIIDMQTRNQTTQPLCLDLEARERQAQAQGSEEEEESRSTTTLEREVSTQTHCPE